MATSSPSFSTDSGSQLLSELYIALEEKYNTPREGVHVSDISLCPRESVFRRLEPQKIDNVQLGFFTSGEAIGVAIQALAATGNYVAEYEVHFEGLQAHIDLYKKPDELGEGIPIECKSANIADMEQPKPHYVSQLKAYMAMTNSHKGIILVQLLQHFKGKVKDKPFRAWVITLTDEQILEEQIRLMKEATSFKEALMRKDPSKARHVMDDKELNWKCNYCHFLSRCQTMNAKARTSKNDGTGMET